LPISLPEMDGYAPVTAIINVSGTITGPGGPAEGVKVLVNSHLAEMETITDANGQYSVDIEHDGQLYIHVRPPFVAPLLSQANFFLSGVSGNVIHDVTLSAAYLLEVTIEDSEGAPVTDDLQLNIVGLMISLPEFQWYTLENSDSSATYRAALPADIYYVTINNPPPGHYQTTQPFDLRAGDRSATMTLNDQYVHPIPYEPPDAGKITIGAPDSLGEALVTGTPGAALPLAQVLLVNLSSTHQSDAISEGDGSFSARIYAPPGSAIQIKHGPASHRWWDLDVGMNEGINPFPGTIIHAPYAYDDGDPETLTFATAGLVEGEADILRETLNYVGAAWAMTGTMKHAAFDGIWTQVISGTYGSQLVPGLYLGGLNWTHPALGDLDDDGDLDMLVGERSGTLLLYRNTGSPSVPGWQYESRNYAGVNSGNWAYPALADVNNDGALDLFVGLGNGEVDVYYNQGTAGNPIWPASPQETLIAGPSAAPALADLDNDDDLDLLVGDEGGRLIFFQNNGNINEADWAVGVDSYGGISESCGNLSPSFINLNDNARLDLLLGCGTHLVGYAQGGPANNPTWTRTTEGYPGLEVSSALSPGLGDWDDDGDLDLVTGEHWGNRLFFRNRLDELSADWEEIEIVFPFDLDGDSAPALADFWNDDNIPDLLVGQVHGNVMRYDNAGTIAEPDWSMTDTVVTLPWTDHPHAFPALGDLNDDGLVDLLVGEGGWGGEGLGGTLHFYENKGSAAAPNWTDVITNYAGINVDGWSTPVLIDIDNDADLDLFVGNEEGYVSFFKNTTDNPQEPEWAAPAVVTGIDFGTYAAPAFFDLDQDGDLDMLVGLGDGTLTHLENVGDASAPEWELAAERYQGIDAGSHATPAAADLNGDTLPDLLLGGEDGGLRLYIYDGPGIPKPTDPAFFEPGDLVKIEGVLQLHSQAITATTDVEAIIAWGGISLQKLFNADGSPQAATNYFMSTMLTPSGFPIQGGGPNDIGLNRNYTVKDLQYVGGNTVAGQWGATIQLPSNLEPGIYRPQLFVVASDVPTSTQWLAAYVNNFMVPPQSATLPPFQVGEVAEPRMIWRLLMDDFVQGTRGAGAREDEGRFGLASQIVSQGAAYYLSPVDLRTGRSITYRLEPFLPMISFSERRLPGQPALPLKLPGGEMCVIVHQPDGSAMDLGCEGFAQSFNRTKTTRSGVDLNGGTVQLDDVYSLKVAGDRFRFVFEQYGHHLVEMAGSVEDPWGNVYAGGGSYDVWVAHSLDIDPGILPGTPLTIGDAFNPSMQFYPRVPAEVNLTVSHYPASNPDFLEVYTTTGRANDFGYFNPTGPPILLESPGEFRVDVQAIFTDTDGLQYMGSMAWGSVVATPDDEAQLVAHGRRGLDSLVDIPNTWFKLNSLSIPQGAISHAFNPYLNGDILWSRMSDVSYGGDSLLIVGSLQDTVGTIAGKLPARINRMHLEISSPGDLSERINAQELPLFISTWSGQAPQLVLGQIGAELPEDVDQLAYSYRSSQRPGLRVREMVSEDNQNGGYWRLDTLYDDQLSVGVLGDQVNDFKLQFVGAVYRDLETGLNEYLVQGSGWIFIPDSDQRGSRVMPPFAGPGNGGWTTDGGPILTLKGQDIHMFILPTGVRPGAVLEEGDLFHFSGQLMPTLNSQVAVTVTAPGGAAHLIRGQANKIGYYYDPAESFEVNEPGLWTVDVKIWHDGQIGDGQSVDCDPADPFDPVRPCPSGDVLGSDGGRYVFYVSPTGAPRLAITSPLPGFLTFPGDVIPVTISGVVPPGLDNVSIEYTMGMPGYILKRGQATVTAETFSFTYDPMALQMDFPNLDLIDRDDVHPGLADTIAMGILLKGQTGDETIYRVNSVTLQGEQVFLALTPPPKARGGGPYAGDEGQPIALDASASADPAGIWLYQWDCENDTIWDASTTLPDDSSCTYGDNGVYEIGLLITASTGLTDTTTTTVVITNLPPVVDAGSGREATRGIEITFNGVFTDAGWLDTHTIEWDFGDEGLINGDLTPSMIFPITGTFPVTLTVTDDDGGVGSDQLWVTVKDDKPILESLMVMPAVINEGQTITLTANILDDTPDVTYTLEINWGDGDGDTFAIPAGSTTVEVSHLYSDDDPSGTAADDFTIKLSIKDNLGAGTSQNSSVRVRNVAPIVEAGPDKPATLNAEIDFSGHFDDPGLSDTHTILWDFGGSDTAAGTLTPTYTYTQTGVFQVTLTVTDDDGGVGFDSLTVTVSDLHYLYLPFVIR